MEPKSSNYAIPVWLPIVLLIVILFGGLLYFQKNSSTNVSSTFSLTPTYTPGTQSAEPLVSSWKLYQNSAYTFSLNVPDGWNIQDYAQFYVQGGTVIAFSPDTLPCGTCTYVHDGFFSVHIYNQKTDLQSYTSYEDRVKQVGKVPGLAKVIVGGNEGILLANSVAVPHGDWIYEFLLDKDNGTQDATTSAIFQKAVTSLQFTDLKFAP